MIEVKTNIDKLRGIALDQYGYVTASQALDAGVGRAALSMLKKRGRVELVAHGVYRVPQVPPTELDRFMLAVLWTGAEEAALAASEVSAAEEEVVVTKEGGEMYVMLKSGELVAVEIPEITEVTKEEEKGFDKFCNWWNGLFGGNQ